MDELYHSLGTLPFGTPTKRLSTRLKPPLARPLSGFYLGFTPVERRRGSQLHDWLRRAGIFSPPGRCEICGAPNGCYHSENYYDIRTARVVCQQCHRVLHRRRSRPGDWLRLVQSHARTGKEWFVITPLDPDTDFAGHLRGRFGEDYDLLSASLQGLPAALIQRFPYDQLLSLSDQSAQFETGFTEMGSDQNSRGDGQ